MFSRIVDFLTQEGKTEKEVKASKEMQLSMLVYMFAFISCGICGSIDQILVYLNTMNGQTISNETIHAFCGLVLIPALTSMLNKLKVFLTEDKNSNNIPDFLEEKEEKDV